MDACSPPEQYLYLTVEPSLQPQCYLLFNIVCIPTLDLQLEVKYSIFQSYLNINYSVFVGGNMKSLFFYTTYYYICGLVSDMIHKSYFCYSHSLGYSLLGTVNNSNTC